MLARKVVLPPEVSDILIKLLKSHEENATGDVQMLCKLFSEQSNPSKYTILLREPLDCFVAEVNNAIREGRVSPKIAWTLHVFNHSMKQMLIGVPSSQPWNTISGTTLQNVASYVSPLETQKDILCQ
ncbi:hypothetical protein P5673_023144, partial [Acropora cervicornis]